MNMSKSRFLLTLCCTAFFLTSCAGTGFSFDKTQPPVSQENRQGWWQSLNDPLVNEFAAIALRQNIDIQIAQARLREARAVRQTAVSGFFPDISANGSASRGEVTTPKLSTLGQVGFDTQWELDVFGQTRAVVNAAEARAQSARANIDDVRNILIADVARAVTEWRQAQTILMATRSLVNAQDETIDILSARSKAGLSDASALERAKAQQAQTRTNLDTAKASANAAQFQIERLLNVRDQTVATILSRDAGENLNIPALNTPTLETIDAITIDVIRDRPDLRASRANLLAARADLKAAEAQLWPRLGLSSFFGVQDGSDGLQLAGNPVWSLASNITVPILNFGRLRGAVTAADARTEQALLAYENAVNLALQETRTALSDYLNGMNAVGVQNISLESRQRALALSKERFTRGLSDMTDVTTAQAELDNATITLINQKAAARVAYIRLQKALGL